MKTEREKMWDKEVEDFVNDKMSVLYTSGMLIGAALFVCGVLICVLEIVK